MTANQPRELVVIGAGPKAAAIAARLEAIRQLAPDLILPNLTVIEKKRPGANWVENNGYTDGKRLLCTPAERDICFPYDDNSEALNEVLLERFSWQSFLLSLKEKEYSQWVDGGSQHPTHSQLADYVEWVLGKCSLRLVKATVVSISLRHRKWLVRYQQNSGRTSQIFADGLVLTGPGPPKATVKTQAQHKARVFDAKSVWKSFDRIDHLASASSDPIGVIGSGGTAAAIVGALIEKFGDKFQIHVYSRKGTLYTRGENRFERQLFSIPVGWTEWGLEARKEFLTRVDQGVISNQLLTQLSRARNVSHFHLDAKQTKTGMRNRKKILLVAGTQLTVNKKTMKSCNMKRSYPVSCLIDATGFDGYWFANLMPKPLAKLFRNESDLVERSIADNLAVDFNRLLRMALPTSVAHTLPEELFVSDCQLHLPMQAGLAQGPGFPNLGCLGLLARRIIGA